MTMLIIIAASLVVGFIAGLLVGRKNPKIATTAATTIQSAENLAKNA